MDFSSGLPIVLQPRDHGSDFSRSLDADVVQELELRARHPPEIAKTAVSSILKRFHDNRPEVDSVLGCPVGLPARFAGMAVVR